jgi:hypothetical protein
MNAIPEVKERQTGRVPSTAVTNELARAVIAMTPPFNGGQVPGSFASRWQIGVVTDHGPAGQANFTDDRYWVLLSRIDALDSVTSARAEPTTHLTTSAFEANDIVCSTNLYETSLDKEEGGVTAFQAGTHLVPVGTRVLVFFDHDGANNERHCFMHPVSPCCVVRIGGNATGGGWYTGNILKSPTADPDPNTTLGDDDIGIVGPACYIANAQERGQATHELTTGSPVSKDYPGIIQARRVDDMPVVVINGIDSMECTTS